MTTVTISGQTGSRARDIGRAVARHLEIDYVDREILAGAAHSLGVPMESVVNFDERAAGLGERLAGMLRRFLERTAAAGAADPMLGNAGLDLLLGRSYAEIVSGTASQEVSPERYVDALCSIVRDLAAHGDVVIIGRGSQVILHDWPGVCHVLVTAPSAWRVEQVARVDNVSPEEAEKRVQEGDRGRIEFHKRFFKVNPDDPTLYHLTLNSARFSVETSAALIADVARRVAAEASSS